ncbi:hypothetical protein Tco_0949503 [Tanacetum coccineum]
MRPFGYPMTILNTLDPLGKFDGNTDEGFLVRYSINSKAFRVFNTRTRKVEENLHITFLENNPNIAGSVPDWLFDIDLLTNSMNYEPVTAGNQTNRNASIKDNVDAEDASTFVSTVSPQRNADTTADDLTLVETLMEIRKSVSKDKGKAKMDETESPRKMKQRDRVQISRDEEVAQKLQEEFDAAERQRMAQCSEEDLPIKLVELVNQRNKFFSQQRAEAKRKKPMTPAQQKDYMSNYIKNQGGGYSIKQLKSFSFEQVKDIFETTMKRVQSFVPIGSELEVQRLKRACQEVLEKPVKRQKIGEASGSGEEQSAEKEKELSEEELQKLLVIVPMEELVIQPLQVRYSIIDWEVYSEDTRRDDLVKLWDLVKETFSTTEPTDDKENEMYMHDPLVWWLYNTCGVHHVSSVRGYGIFMLVEKEYPLTRGTLGLMMVARLLVEADKGLIQKLDDLKVNHKYMGGLLGIRGFYNLMLLVQVCAAAED